MTSALPGFVADLLRGRPPAPFRLALVGLGLALGTVCAALHLGCLVQALRVRQYAPGPLAGALTRFAAVSGGAAPAGTLGAADRHLAARIERLGQVEPGPARAPGAVRLGALLLLALPVCLLGYT